MKTSRAPVFTRRPTKTEVDQARDGKIKMDAWKLYGVPNPCKQEHNFIQLRNLYDKPGGIIVWKRAMGLFGARSFDAQMIIFCTKCGEFRREPEWS